MTLRYSTSSTHAHNPRPANLRKAAKRHETNTDYKFDFRSSFLSWELCMSPMSSRSHLRHTQSNPSFDFFGQMSSTAPPPKPGILMNLSPQDFIP